MENYFREALHNFIFDEAGGGAIRHLADRGYTARQIADSLSFPVPYETVRESVTKYLMESGILLKVRPEAYREPEKTEYVREYDRYGKPSFRKVAAPGGTGCGKGADGGTGTEKWREMDFSAFLLLYKGGEKEIKLPAETEHREAKKEFYIACDFGMDGAQEQLKVLDRVQREYIQGICWMRRRMYHLLDKRMLEIAVRLREEGFQAGNVYMRFYIKH